MNKLIYLIIIFGFNLLPLLAQNTADSTEISDLYQAYRNIRKMDSPQLQQDGVKTFMKYALKGNLKAMNMVGYLYEHGIGTRKDKEKAIFWYLKASDNNYIPALINLARIYKRQANFKKSYEYACKLAKLSHPAGYYMKGYHLYKGISCQQNYAQAFAEFEKGTLQNDRYCLYMLGICYRNGYGVKRDINKATELLNRSKLLGNMSSLQELVAEEPENPMEPVQLEGDSLVVIENISNIPVVNHIRLSNKNSGIYRGNLMTYDWSGKHLLNISPLSIELSISGNTLTGQWQEGNGNAISIEGIQTDSCVGFKNMEYDKEERELHNSDLKWIFKNASLHTYYIGNTRYLCGTVRQYSPELAEYSRPMYFLLNNQEVAEFTDNFPVSVFPNPFNSDLTVCLDVKDIETATISIHTLMGNPVYRKNIKINSEGKNYYLIHTSFPSGQYILNVQYGETCLSYPIQKE